MICAVCSDEAKGRQWYNRDKGFGLCVKCHHWLKNRGESDEEIHKNFGVEGLHFFSEAKPYKPHRIKRGGE